MKRNISKQETFCSLFLFFSEIKKRHQQFINLNDLSLGFQGKGEINMTKLALLDPNEESAKSSSPSKQMKFDEEKLCKAFLHKFYTMGILTESEHGTVIGSIGRGKYSPLQ